MSFVVNMSSETASRELIIRLFQENPQSSQKTIARKAKVYQKPVSNVIKNFNENLNVFRKIGSGRRKFFVYTECEESKGSVREKSSSIKSKTGGKGKL